VAVDGDPGHPKWVAHRRDSGAFAKRYYQAFRTKLHIEMPKASCEYTFLYLFERVELEKLFGLLRQWMLTSPTTNCLSAHQTD
jgi:hypothetical protein